MTGLFYITNQSQLRALKSTGMTRDKYKSLLF